MRFFDHPPADDIALRRAAQPVAAGLDGRLPEASWLHSLTGEHGVDFATAVLYEALRAHPKHGEFAARIEALAMPREGGVAGKLVVVPGLVWEDYPQLGADGNLIIDVARRLGFDVERVPVRGRSTLSSNARDITQFVAGLEASDAWLVSLSKGSADLRLAMSGRFGAFPWGKFRGWINICGSPNGSDLASLLTATPLRRLEARALCLASRIPFQAMLEIASSHESWCAMPASPAGFHTINIVGLPLRWHVSRMLAARHRMLSALGPNDGVVLCANAFVLPGVIYPLWGYDHYFRGAGMVPLLYRLFAHVRALARRTPEADRHLAS